MDEGFKTLMEAIQSDQGWSDKTLGFLALDFILEHPDDDLRKQFLARLGEVQSTENSD